MNTFWLLTGLMSLVALGFVVPPLWRRRATGASAEEARLLQALAHAHAAGVLTDEEYETKRAAATTTIEPANEHGSRPWLAALLVVLCIPVGAWLMYRDIGSPAALDPTNLRAPAAAGSEDGTPPPTMEQAIAGLAERLKADPDDLDGWMLLGRAYKSTEQFEQAREAMANAYRLAPDEPDVMIEYAEALALAHPEHRFEGQSLELLQKATARAPEHQRGLWLLGIAATQAGDDAAAVGYWQKLLALLPADAEARGSLEKQLAEARERAGMAPAPASAPVAPSAPAASADGPRLTVQVDIAPALRGKVAPTDTLFVYARAPQGPRMPLAIQRMPASKLPVTVTLDDTMGMMPQMKLSSMPQVVVGARVSKSGQALRQPGDLEVTSEPVPSSRREPLQLTIDRVVE